MENFIAPEEFHVNFHFVYFLLDVHLNYLKFTYIVRCACTYTYNVDITDSLQLILVNDIITKICNNFETTTNRHF